MAKTLGVRVSASANITNLSVVDEAVLSPVTPSDTLGGIVQKIHGAEADEMVSVVDVENGIVHSRFATGINAAALIDAVIGTTIVGALKQADPSKASGVFIQSTLTDPTVGITDADTQLETVVSKPSLVSRNTASAINAILDDLALPTGSVIAMDQDANKAFIVADQHTGLLTLIQVANANCAAVRALFDDGGTLEDSVRYEQIPASSVAGSRLPLE